MPNKYLGEFPVDVSKHPEYSKWTPADWAMVFIEKYSGIDGDHHKTWVFDQVARILKGDARLAVIPIVAVTSYAIGGDREAAACAGCDGYLEKPIDPDRFAQELQRVLGGDAERRP